jgi:glycosyltransferase involved in cell wall biosynthesis
MITSLPPIIVGKSGITPASKEITTRTSAEKNRGYSATQKKNYFPIIAFSHLGWDWVWQRPQQYLSRLAKKHRVLFVESRRSEQAETTYQLQTPEGHSNVTVFQIHFPSSRWEDYAFIDLERRKILLKVLGEELAGQFESPILWFYDPMTVNSAIGHLDEQVVVYDCMDELSQFKGAPAELVSREQALVRSADVVFCGGRKMREKRLPLNANTHFFGTGVDCAHFGSALNPALPVASEIAALSGPVLGYFGVVDERIDYDLLAELADARKDWSIVMVGPAIKVDPATFPQRKNLHWLGGRQYADLPAITKGFDVCLMPFALNAATEYINPTKALEYMAAGKPVVSTSLSEVRSNFRGVARIGESHEEFIELCQAEASNPSKARIKKGLVLAAANTWESNLARMEALIAEALTTRSLEAAQARKHQKNAASAPSPINALSYV